MTGKIFLKKVFTFNFFSILKVLRFLRFLNEDRRHESTTQEQMVYVNTVYLTNLQWAKEKNTMCKAKIKLTNLTNYN